MERARGEARRPRICLSMYSITENICHSQLSSVAILLQPEPNCFTSYNTSKWLGSLSLRAIFLRIFPPSHVSTCNGQRSSQLFCVHYTCSGPGAWWSHRQATVVFIPLPRATDIPVTYNDCNEAPHYAVYPHLLFISVGFKYYPQYSVLKQYNLRNSLRARHRVHSHK
jgi:hypothetical protein